MKSCILLNLSVIKVLQTVCYLILYNRSNMAVDFSDHVCSDGHFRCHNGKCIKSNRRCDGDASCIDGSDEENCQCLADEFECERSGECISLSQLCNNVEHCADGSDERNCGKDNL